MNLPVILGNPLQRSERNLSTGELLPRSDLGARPLVSASLCVVLEIQLLGQTVQHSASLSAQLRDADQVRSLGLIVLALELLQ